MSTEDAAPTDAEPTDAERAAARALAEALERPDHPTSEDPTPVAYAALLRAVDASPSAALDARVEALIDAHVARRRAGLRVLLGAVATASIVVVAVTLTPTRGPPPSTAEPVARRGVLDAQAALLRGEGSLDALERATRAHRRARLEHKEAPR